MHYLYRKKMISAILNFFLPVPTLQFAGNLEERLDRVSEGVSNPIGRKTGGGPVKFLIFVLVSHIIFEVQSVEA
jgi:hypothetical protein